MKRVLTYIAFAVLPLFSAVAQWSNNHAEPYWVNDDGAYFYEYNVAQSPNGKTWLWLESGQSHHYVQLFDTTGVTLLGDEMKLVSDYQNRLTGYVNQNMFVDRDGNAIIVVSDLRYSSVEEDLATFTAYKISQEGEMLWGTQGVSLDGGVGTSIGAMMGIAQLTDGSYVFAWTHSDYEIFTIELQRVSADGELLWDANETRLTDPRGEISYFWPYIVDAGNNQCILVYTKGANLELHARKIDFDGAPVWSEDTRIYRSGFLSTPLWTLLTVEPSGDGGVVVTWYDDRNATGIESIYMSYVKPNGELGFTAGIDGQKLCYSDLRALSTTCKYDPASDSFIALWREATQAQGAYRVVVQSVSKDGDLLWGDEGLEVETLTQDVNYGDLTLHYGREGEMALFYLKRNGLDFGNIDVRMQLLDTRKGELLWNESRIISDANTPTEKTDFHVSAMSPQQSFVIGWDDRGVDSNPDYKRIYLHRVNYDATIGNPVAGDDASVATLQAGRKSMTVVNPLVSDQAHFVVRAEAGTPATLTIYNMNGVCVATPFDGVCRAAEEHITWRAPLSAGIYIATLRTPTTVENIKLLIL